jgi:hypothetical protein
VNKYPPTAPQFVADSSPEEPASVTTSIDEEVPTVQKRTKNLGGVDKWKFAPTVPKVRTASRRSTIAEGQSDKARQPTT